MSKTIEIGTKVRFMHEGDRREGVVHGIRTWDQVLQVPDKMPEVEEGQEAPEQTFTEEVVHHKKYLVDTGNDVRTDEYVHNARREKISELVAEAVADEKIDTSTEKAWSAVVNKVSSRKDLPKDKDVVEVVRQPETLEFNEEDLEIIQEEKSK